MSWLLENGGWTYVSCVWTTVLLTQVNKQAYNKDVCCFRVHPCMCSTSWTGGWHGLIGVVVNWVLCFDMVLRLMKDTLRMSLHRHEWSPSMLHKCSVDM